MKADNYDVMIVDLELLDKDFTVLSDQDQKVEFVVDGDVTLLCVDNGWEMNTQIHKTNQITTHNGRALAFFQAKGKSANLKISSKTTNKKSNDITINV